MAKVSRFGLVVGLLVIALGTCLLFLILTAGQQGVSQIGGSNRIYSSSAGEDGTLYLISGKYINYNIISNRYDSYGSIGENASISALARDGSLKWERPLREICPAENDSSDQYYAEIKATDDDSVYVLIDACDQMGSNVTTVLAAISSQGELRWAFPIQTPDKPAAFGFGSKVFCIAGRVYLNANLSEYVLDKQGNVISKVDLAPGVTVGPDGGFYVKKAASTNISFYPDGHVSSAGWASSEVFQAYSRDGGLLWERNLSDYPVAYLSNTLGDTAPALRDDLVYIVLENGVLALDTGGKTRWVWQCKDRESFSPYGLMLYDERPFDSRGNVYLYTPSASRTGSGPGIWYDFYVISPEGKLIRTYTETNVESKNVLAQDDELQYYTPDIPADSAKAVIPETVKSLYDLDTVTVKAYDTAGKADRWSVKLPISNITTVTVTPENSKQLFPYRISSDIEMMNLFNHDYDNKLTPYHDVFNKTPSSILSLKEASALISGDIVYVNLYTYSYETPTEYNRSRCAYASTLYAIGKNGTLLWQKPVDRSIYWMAAGNNGTIYYSTSDGKIFTTAMYVAGGLTVAAILYTLAHFFGAGTVARARSRLDANENRNSVLGYIAANPGSTMRDVARGLDMNLGTIRYHLLILGLNHRIASYQADGKHMRYFVNSGAYTGEEQRIIAAVRREGMRKVIESLLRQPGQSNKGLSAAVGMRESAISRYIGELISAGLVEKTVAQDGCTSYSIKSGAGDSIVAALELVSGKAAAGSVEPKAPRAQEK